MKLFYDALGKEFKKPEEEKVSWRLSGYPVVMKEGKLLMVIPHWNTLWELPGGGIEEDEKIKDGIIRECLEETGYTITVRDDAPLYIGESNFYHTDDTSFRHGVHFFYQAALTKNNQDKKAIHTEEIKTIEWVSLEALTDTNTHPIIHPVIDILKKNKTI